jgi:hypothetical protein
MGTIEEAIQAILLKLNATGFCTRYEGDGEFVSLVATHRLHGHFFAYRGSVGNEYEAACILAEMCGLEQIGEDEPIGGQ